MNKEHGFTVMGHLSGNVPFSEIERFHFNLSV